MMEGPEPIFDRSIQFTQFLRPDGRRTTIWIDRPDAIVDMAEVVIGAGYHFEIEELRTGIVSMTVSGPSRHTDENVDLAIELVRNGPGVPEAVDRLVAHAHARLKTCET